MRALVDTNLLVYAAGLRTTRERQQEAIAVLDAVRGDAALTVQSLAEFSAVALREGMPPAQCRDLVAAYQRSWTVLAPSAQTVASALAAVAAHVLSFWDAMQWAVAREHGLQEMLTEDGPTEAVIEGVRFRNPLKHPG